MNASPNNRGIFAVRAALSPARVPSQAAEMIDGLCADIDKFRAKYDDRFDDIEASVDQAVTSIAAMKTNGIDAPIGNIGRSPKAMLNLGKFGRTGDQEALNSGLTIQASLSVGSNPDGGYTVPEELADSIISVQRDMSAVRRIASVIRTNSAEFSQPVNIGGMASGWVSETASRTETASPSFNLVQIPSGEIYANPAITQQLMDDSKYNLGEFINDQIAQEFTEREGAAFIAGDGVNKPSGFMTGTITNEADSARAFGSLQYLPSGSASDILADNLIDLVFGLGAKYRQNGTWLMNSATLSALMKLKDGQGNYLWSNSYRDGAPVRLLGYPTEIDELMPDISADAYPIAFGDFKRGYMITDRVDMRLLRDPYTNKPYIMFYATKRVGGKLMDSNAIKLMKVAVS